jgi:hypothetical protein
MWYGLEFGFGAALGIWLFIAALRMIKGGIEGAVDGWRRTGEEEAAKKRAPIEPSGPSTTEFKSHMGMS